jgi:hypothetical protein
MGEGCLVKIQLFYFLGLFFIHFDAQNAMVARVCFSYCDDEW